MWHGISGGVQAILKFCISRLRGCNIGTGVPHIPSFIKISLRLQRLLRKIHTDSKMISYA
jgi:hypothetical protein